MAKWPTVKIGDVCVVERGGSPRPIDQYITTAENGVNWIKIGDTSDSMYITSTAQKIIPAGMKKSRYVQPGDFLLSNSMSFGRPYILKIDGCIHDGWLLLRDTGNIFDKEFLYYYLSAPSTYQIFKSLAVGGVVNNLNSEMVRKLKVPLPVMDEQRHIANVLNRITNLVTLRKQQLAKLDELVKARFVEMFGDLGTNSKKWPDTPLVTCCNDPDDIKCGPFGTQLSKAEYQTAGIPLWGIPQVNSYFKKPPVDYLSEGKAQQLMAYSLIPDDIVMSRKGNVGMCAIYPNCFGLGIIHSDVLRIRVNQKQFNPYFLMCQLHISPRVENQINVVSSGAIMAGINVSKLKNILVHEPPIELQNEFAEFYKKVDSQKLTIQQSLDKLELLKKALMQEYFG